MEQEFEMFGVVIQLAAVFLFCWGVPRKWYRILLSVIAGCVFVWVISKGFVLGVRYLFGLSVWDLQNRKLFCMVVVSAGHLLVLLGAWIVRQIRIGIRIRWLVLTLLFPVLSLAMLLIMLFTYLGRTDISETTFFFCCLLELSNFAAVGLIHATQKSTLLGQEMALLNQQLQIQSESIVSLEKSYRTQRQSTHDYQNQLRTIYRLLCDGQDASAREYVAQLMDVQSERVFSVNTGNPIIDAVVHQKFQVAHDQGVEASFRGNDLSAVNLKMNELVVLLSNLLDNAIEGCARCTEDRKLECSMVLEDGLFLSVRNTSPAVKIRGKHIPTTKEPKHEHGYGLRTISRILDQHKALYSFRYADGWFEFVAEIPNGKAGAI